MPDRARVGIEIDVQSRAAGKPVDESEPFRIALMGDFSGRANRGLKGGAHEARPILLDRDNFDAVLKKCAPSLDLRIPGTPEPLHLAFTSLDDFRPEALSRLVSAPPSRRKPPPEKPRPQPPLPPAPGGLLDQMVEAAEPASPRQAASRAGDLQGFLDRVTAGHTVPSPEPGELEAQARVEASVSEQLRAVLHHADFQALEAAWRSAFFLVRRLETGADLKVFLFDISQQELRDDLEGAADLRRTDFFRHAAGLTADQPWAILGANYSFSASPDDVNLLARIALIAAQQRVPFLAAAEPSAWGARSLEGMPDPRDWEVDSTAAEYWQTLRQIPEAAFIGLLAPHFLLRLPYGAGTDEVEGFAFEELAGAPVPHPYLWGNPGVIGLCLLGQTFARDGWNMRPGAVRELSGLPLHVYERDGESQTQPCAEALLTDRAADAIARHGIMPLLAERGGDRLLLSRFQSLADPPRALAGRW